MRRVVVVDPAWTMADDAQQVFTTPEGSLDNLGAFLDRVAAKFHQEGVVLLTTNAGLALGAPVSVPDVDLETDPFLNGAPGWTSGPVRPWVTFRREGHALVHVGFLGLMTEADRFPLRGAMYLDTMNRLAYWHRFTGAAYHGSPGVAGDDLLRVLAHAPRGKSPYWCPPDRWTVPEWEDCERPYKVNGAYAWSRSEDSVAEVGYDANKAYLAAASTVELAPGTLERRGQRKFDRKRAGYWLAEICPWPERRIPDPAGPASVAGARWVTTPTLALLEDLRDEGKHGGFEILDSYTAPGHRILRPWAEKIRDGLYGDHPIVDDDDEGPAALRSAFAAVYKATHGMVKQNGDVGRTRRPDWYYAWMAQARVTLWRKMWTAGKAGRWPLRIDVDNVWYSCESESDEPPAGFVLGTKLGEFKVKGFNVRKVGLPI